MSEPANPNPPLEFQNGKVLYKGQSFNLLVGIMLLPNLDLSNATVLPGYVVVPNNAATPVIIETFVEEVTSIDQIDVKAKVEATLEHLHQAVLNAQAEREALVAAPLPQGQSVMPDIAQVQGTIIEDNEVNRARLAAQDQEVKA